MNDFRNWMQLHHFSPVMDESLSSKLCAHTVKSVLSKRSHDVNSFCMSMHTEDIKWCMVLTRAALPFYHTFETVRQPTAEIKTEFNFPNGIKMGMFALEIMNLTRVAFSPLSLSLSNVFCVE